MKVLITGGAGFIGRWTVRKFINMGHEVVVLDNLSNGSQDNIKEFLANPRFKFVKGDIIDSFIVNDCFNNIDLCLHLAAQINVQESLDYPERAFKNNVLGTYNILDAARKNNTKVVLMGTCMVYDLADSSKAIDETHSVKPKSPYAGSKLAAEYLEESYHYGFRLQVIIVRPFNTYGPFQKSNTEGGVVSIFINRTINGELLNIFGDGTQTRDLLYVEDCANFIYKAATNPNAVGQIFNAGSGNDITINELAKLICEDKSKIKHVQHHHPQAEIMKLACDYKKAKDILGWEPKIDLIEGIKRTEDWIKTLC